MDFNERVIPGTSANFLYQEALARYVFADKIIKKDHKVLDVGCGTGYGTDFLAGKADIIGVDNSKEAIRYAKKHYKRTTFRQGDALNLNFKNNMFNVVVSFELIEHLINPDKYLKEIARVLTKKGNFVLSTPNSQFPKITQSPYHEKEYSKKELEKILKRHFKKVTIYGQRKNKKAQSAFQEFLKSQNARQSVVDADTFGIRKIIPRSVKEKAWKYIGNPLGRGVQDKLETKDFPISKDKLGEAEYFVGVCQK